MGVFINDEQPNRSRAPQGLRFHAADGDFTTLSPQLKQVFFIGSGIAKSGAMRRFLIPPGATRLFLGTMDEYGWYNNIGTFVVTVTLERGGVTSNTLSVDSSVSFANWECMPGHRLCTPERAIIAARGPGLFHVLLPAQLERGASVPLPTGAAAVIRAASGTVCLDPTPESCSGPKG